jgi:DNA polymerase II large subunit
MDYNGYLKHLQEECNSVYEVAQLARSKGFDPKNFVEIPQAHDLADRTQKLLKFLHTRDTASQIRELTEIHDGNRELVALEIGKVVSAESYLYGGIEKCSACNGKGVIKKDWREDECRKCEGKGFELSCQNLPHWKETLEEFSKIEEFEDSNKIALSIYHGVCAGLAVLTEGILVAPLEGVASARMIENRNGTKAVAISFAGPIRSAGGTGQALSVLIADIVRRNFQIGKPVMTNNEVERYKEEVSIYARGLQYRPSNPQLEVIARNCPIYIDGEGVGNEVTGQRDLARVPTNKVREGAVLVMCEGLVLKAPKIMKYVKALGLDGWDWLNEFISDSKDDGKNEIKPSEKFVSDVLAGRPIFGMPMREGGFRLRYGRSRLAGLATTAVHPATMKALAGFIITGTQMKYERPGKATVTTPCTEVEGPYIQFKDGSAKRIVDSDEIPDGMPIDAGWNIEKIWDLGELLVPIGEFLENNHPIMPSPYVHEWHEQLVDQYPQSYQEAVKQSREMKIPLAPEYVAHYSDISADELLRFVKALHPSVCDGMLEVQPKDLETAYRLNIDVMLKDGKYYLHGDKSYLLTDQYSSLNKAITINMNLYENALHYLNDFLDFEIKPKVTYRIGARMGKPEGAKLREMKPAIHTLFPLGHEVGSQRKIVDAIKKQTTQQMGVRSCIVCGAETHMGVHCGENTKFIENKYDKFDLQSLWNEAKWKAGIYADLPIKGTKGMTSAEKCPENMLKGILRHNNDISVFRDGTIRFDMVDITMTHFKPKEISLTAEKARELGYEVESDESVVELFPQDIVVSRECAEVMLKTTQYMDDLMVKLYGLEPFYNCKTVEDMFGHLCMGLAPHTSGAILCRLIGVAEIKGHYGHPFFHAGKRRNCDGDIDCVLLLLDGLINFSRSFLATTRGGQMDAPLILTTKLNPSEIDKEALNVDINSQYPVAFYELSQSTPNPKEVLKVGVKTVETVLGTPEESRGFGYTHDTKDCAEGPKNNPYNTLESMRQKTMVQFALGDTLHSVDNTEQSSKLIDRHLIRDMRGNLRAFGQQKVRCTKCGESYRRPPINGKCRTVVETKKNPFNGEIEEVICPGNIILTVTQGAINKYDGLMGELVSKHGCDDYTEQMFGLVSTWVKETFRSEDESKQNTLW